MPKLKLSKIGNSIGVIFPEEMLTRLKVEEGDNLYAIETKGGYLVTPKDPGIAGQLDAGREFLKDYQSTFNALADKLPNDAGSA